MQTLIVVNAVAEAGYVKPKSDVVFIDSLQKALKSARGNQYDYWGNPVSATYLEKGLVPLLELARDRLSPNFIVQGNFLRASGGLTTDGNMSYVRDYIDSAYLEGFEGLSSMHGTIKYVQQAHAMGKMVAPNFSASVGLPEGYGIEAARKKASKAMPVFWSKIDPKEQDILAKMYSHFDFKLAYFLMLAGEHSYMRISREVKLSGGTDMFMLVPPFPEFDRKLGEPLTPPIRINGTTWERTFKYCKVRLDVEGVDSFFDWSFRGDGKYETENMALGKLATQVNTDQEGVASRVNDGNTDGDWAKGSVNLTKKSRGMVWWELDLGAIREIGKIDVWNRTGDEKSLTNFHVLVSTDPFKGSFGTNLPGVKVFKVDGKCGTPSSIPVNIAGRYVRVQLDKDGGASGQLSLAEVQVWSAPARKNSPPVATAQSVQTGINDAIEINLSGSDKELNALTASIDTMPSHGTISLKGNVATYQPNKNYSGSDSFTFKVKDANFTSKAVTVSITVESLLYAHWALDEGTGSVAKDSSAHGRDAAIIDGTWVEGIKGKALKLNGTSTTVTLPASTFSSISDEFTIALWLNGGDSKLWGCSLSAEDASGNSLMSILLPFGSNVRWKTIGGRRGEEIIKPVPTDNYKGTWNHWAFTKNAKTGVMSIYYNGALFHSEDRKITPIGKITSVSMGRVGKFFCDGAIDNVRVYKKALSAAEVKELYLSEQ